MFPISDFNTMTNFVSCQLHLKVSFLLHLIPTSSAILFLNSFSHCRLCFSSFEQSNSDNLLAKQKQQNEWRGKMRNEEEDSLLKWRRQEVSEQCNLCGGHWKYMIRMRFRMKFLSVEFIEPIFSLRVPTSCWIERTGNERIVQFG